MGLIDPMVLYCLVASLVPGRSVETSNDEDEPRLVHDDRGQIGGVGIVALVLTVLALIIVVFLMSDFADPYFNATENITTAIQNASTGNDTIDRLMPVFGLLTAAILTLGFIVQILELIDL